MKKTLQIFTNSLLAFKFQITQRRSKNPIVLLLIKFIQGGAK